VDDSKPKEKSVVNESAELLSFIEYLQAAPYATDWFDPLLFLDQPET
jgi:hypothetical protein